MRLRFPIILLLLLLTIACSAELRFEGALGNSGGDGESLVKFAPKEAPGMGPVVDEQLTIWERGGEGRLNRYALDGRLLGTFDIPTRAGRFDQLTRVGGLLVMAIGNEVYTLPVAAPPGSQPLRLKVQVEVLGSSAFNGQIPVVEKTSRSVAWLNPVTGETTPAFADQSDFKPFALHVDVNGVLYAFSSGEVRAWSLEGSLLPGYPRGFRGERPQKIGDFWFSHSWHGTINRMNEHFEPVPGVVLGGASGSFIGYLPQSADITNGRGLAAIGNGLFAVSGMKGVVQLLEWNAEEMRLEPKRRIGALPEPRGLAIDSQGQIWTPNGSWRWNDSPETPNTLGDKSPDVMAQPVVLEGRTLCLLKKHYQYVQLASGPLLDGNGWSHFETKGIKDFELPESVTGAAAVPGENGIILVFADQSGKAFEMGVTSEGHPRWKPKPVTIPGLTEVTSLAWFDGQLLAANAGEVFAYQRTGDGEWEEKGRPLKSGGELFIHGDGRRLAVSDTKGGSVNLYESFPSPLASYEGLDSPKTVAVAGDRVVVYEAGKQRLVKLKLDSEGRAPKERFAKRIQSDHSSDFQDSDYLDLTLPAGIPASVALREEKGKLSVSLRTEAEHFTLGIANKGEAFMVRDKRNAVFPGDDWSEMKLALALRRGNQRERIGFTDHHPIHAPFSENAVDWAPFDLAGYREEAEERRNQIRLTFEQPIEGKATLVIENQEGQRIRNLVSGRSFSAGKHTVVWDGFDETGTLVSPGSYRWRGITHPGIKPVYRMNFANGGEPTTAPWGPNHSTFHDAASNEAYLFFAAPVTEGGWALVALDQDGNFVQGYEHQHGYGIQHSAIAADDRYLYCAQDGFAWGGSKGVDFGRPDWKATWKLTVVRYEIESGKMVDFPGRRRAIEVGNMEVGPGSRHPNLDDFNLGGIAVANGNLYVGSRDRKSILVFDAESGEKQKELPVLNPRHLRIAPEGDLWAVTDKGVLRLGDGKTIIESGAKPFAGLAIDRNGDCLVSDPESHQVKRYSKDGRLKQVIGTPGGPYQGTYDPNRMVNPAGLTFGPDGKIWVTEKRWNPKRILAWDSMGKDVVYEKFGMPHYGGDGSGFDPKNPGRWIGLGCFWDVDIDSGTARPTHVMSLEEGHFGNYHPHSYVFFREAGRTFLCARGKIALISEVMPDGTIRDVAATAGTHHFAYGCRWDPPQSYIDAFYEKWPEKRAREKPMGRNGEGKPWRERGMGVLWVDRNGDGLPQKEEFDFCGDDIAYGDGAWGHLQTSLTLSMPVVVDDQVKVVSIAPKGFLDNGIPDYPTLDEAISEATPVSLTPGYKRSGVATIRDGKGRFIFNSDPEMNAYAADGRHLWTYPNQWSNVHGSHKAPLPEPGVMQGTLGILGLASFDDQGELFFLNGNHGRCFLLTTDGLYLDEAFVDVRVSYLKNEYRLGGEIFGGSFGRSQPDGKTYLQIGHGPYRIYELAGIDDAKRISGRLEVTPEQIASAESESLRRAAEKLTRREVSIPGTATWDRNGKYRAEMDIKIEGENLDLTWRVEDSSPWINRGRDWTRLFATGDTVDFQIATDPSTDPKRRGPVEGDKRLMIAPFESKTIAVLFEHRMPGGANPVEFTSPWRAETVDHVSQLSEAKIEVKTEARGYRVSASIPLASLGFAPEAGKTYRADFGVTFGDAGGTDTNLRSYWSNQNTNLVDDIPGEIMLTPNLWGELSLPGKH